MSLIALVEQNNLPDFQFIDKDTLSWIVNNKPRFTAPVYNRDFVEFTKNKVQKFSPLKAWFLKDERIDSIHGMRHILRVIANIAYLVKEKGIVDEYTITNTLIAASLHDLRRKNDKGDKGHADRAVAWLLSNKNSILGRYEVDTGDIDIDAVSAAILLHEQQHAQIIDSLEYKKNKTVVNLLKSGDALDRYRLPKLKWWIDDKYLSLLPSDKARLFAYTLVIDSERNFLEINKSEESVLSALNKMQQL
jgi:hypothetical protein